MRTQNPEAVRERIRQLKVEIQQLRLLLKMSEIQEASRRAQPRPAVQREPAHA